MAGLTKSRVEKKYPMNITKDPTILPRTDATLYGPSVSSGTTGYPSHNSNFWTAVSLGVNWGAITSVDTYVQIVNLTGLTAANPVIMPWCMGPAVNSSNAVTTFKFNVDGIESIFTVKGNRGFIGGGLQEQATAASVTLSGTNSSGFIFHSGYGWANSSFYNQQQTLGRNTINGVMGVMLPGTTIRAGKPCLIAESNLTVNIQVDTSDNGTYYNRGAVCWAYYKGVA